MSNLSDDKRKLDEKRKFRKQKRQAKFRAKLKLRLEKRLLPMHELLKELYELKADLESFNPRMNQLQPHTKSRWLEKCDIAISKAKEVVEPKKKEVVQKV